MSWVVYDAKITTHNLTNNYRTRTPNKWLAVTSSISNLATYDNKSINYVHTNATAYVFSILASLASPTRKLLKSCMLQHSYRKYLFKLMLQNLIMSYIARCRHVAT